MNQRPLPPQGSALAKLSYAPLFFYASKSIAPGDWHCQGQRCSYSADARKIAIYPVRQRLEHKIAAIKILTQGHKYRVQCHVYASCVQHCCSQLQQLQLPGWERYFGQYYIAEFLPLRGSDSAKPSCLSGCFKEAAGLVPAEVYRNMLFTAFRRL